MFIYNIKGGRTSLFNVYTFCRFFESFYIYYIKIEATLIT